MNNTCIDKDEDGFSFAHIPIKITEEKYDKVLRDLTNLVNKHSLENCSDTPDFIVAEYLLNCFFAFNNATRYRTEWYGGQSENVVLSGQQCPNTPKDAKENYQHELEK